MMNSLILATLLCFTAFSAKALSFRVLGKNSELLFEANVKTKTPTDVGHVSLDVFEQFEIPFEGSASGFSKIYGMGQDVDVISDNEMKAYGWCFLIDSVLPETMPDQTPVSPLNSQIEWFYGFAHYKDGNWISQCSR